MQSDHKLPGKGAGTPASSAQMKTTPVLAIDSPNKVNVARNSNTSITNSTAIGAAKPDSQAEQIMLQFQQTMQAMANSFLETQQRVMLAFLETQNGAVRSSNGHTIVQSPNADSTYSPTLVAQAQSPVVVELQSTEIQTGINSPTAESSIQTDTEYLINSLLEIVAERTGYPVDMIDPTLDLEADLGIDSIKRVEILNKFRRLLPESTQQKLESGIEELAGTARYH
jgi:hypothetical protein